MQCNHVSEARKNLREASAKKSRNLSNISASRQGSQSNKLTRAKARFPRMGFDSCEVSDSQISPEHRNKRVKNLEGVVPLSTDRQKQIQKILLRKEKIEIRLKLKKMKDWNKTKMLFPVSANLEQLLKKHLVPLNETSKKIIKDNEEIERLYGIKMYKEYDYKEEINYQLEGMMLSLVQGLKMAKKDSITISENGKLKDSICYEIIERFGLEYRHPTPFLDVLYGEIMATTKVETRYRDWGSIGLKDGELTLFV